MRLGTCGFRTTEVAKRCCCRLPALLTTAAFAAPTKAAIEEADPKNPGVQPRPAIGIQFVDIPEFPDLGTQVSQDVSSAIAGRMSVEDALKRGQELADDVAERYRSRQAK